MFDPKEILEKYKDLFERLATTIPCPKCGKTVKDSKHNLGENYNQFEGCEECAAEENKNETG